MLGTGDAVVIGLGAMIGAGVFVVPALAARAAGSWLLVSLVVAAVVAYCNAVSSARLAARHPRWGGAYVYGRERLGEVWGFLAGWAFVVGKTASCAAMALVFASYVWPGAERWVAVAAVVVLTAVNYRGMRASLWLTRVLLVSVVAVLALVVVVSLWGGGAGVARVEAGPPVAEPGLGGVLAGAGLLFFAFAGYARIATLGGEVRDPQRSIPRAIGVALAVALGVYLAVVVALLAVLGVRGLAGSSAPLADAVAAGGAGWAVPVVAVGAALGSLGALLSLVLGVSRTTAAMAGDGSVPRWLAGVHPRWGVPHRAAVVVGAVVVALVLVGDVRGVVGFSSFGVLVYYAVANASALRLGPDEDRPPLVVPVVGLVGCLVLALCLPWDSVVAGALVVAVGALVWVVRSRVVARRV
ncbi:amino acid/polyamine/organocation transporter, APC superfamily [Marinactinospora thermotolerans DSM 45154]|uniref:Amino acid/polyamine/organocation transporter, APC superfamily n=1 Tax=Marinactinospora thermotolerans DSM 45154 TaxID=1122192 RepID=A0A1T4TE85_9ACTN|nr:amino acid/polyamine/organocation transporter, APC superfamily [Marinactinospora thermotolerans DSM 45154]